MRLIVIGDIHGCIREFQELVELVQPELGDRVICVGDFMDKGPEPGACIRYARKQGFEAIRGNHEEKHLRWRRHENRKAKDPSYKNPMVPLPKKYQEQNAALSAEDIAWLENLPYYAWPGPGWLVVHAGLEPYVDFEDQVPDRMIRLNLVDQEGAHVPIDYDKKVLPEGAVHWTELYDGIDNIIYGHTTHNLRNPIISSPRFGTGTCYGIDTGCVYGGRLTAAVLEVRRERPDRTFTFKSIDFVQVQAHEKYTKPIFDIPETA